MTFLKIAMVQLNNQDDQAANIDVLSGYIRSAAKKGARLIVTPECSDSMMWPTSEKAAQAVVEEEHEGLSDLQVLASELSVHILVGSIAVKSRSVEGKLCNRALMIAPDGEITSRYDKIHLFDAKLSKDESYQESAYYECGDKAVVAETALAPVGISICYDVRFANLYRALAKAGAKIVAVPAAFSVPTGKAHWEVLLRARAIETGCFIIASGQTGIHPGGRATYGHSMIVSPWGEVVVKMDDQPGFEVAEIDLSEVDRVRAMLPSLDHDRGFAAS